MKKNKVTIAVVVLGLLCAPLLAFADSDYSKFGVTKGDIASYQRLSIPSCVSAREENKDPWRPPANVNYLSHLAHLYGQCHNALQHEHAAIGVLHANDIFFGMTCMSLGMVDTQDAVDPVCNIPSSLPNPQ
jgi:hypothetical protein